ncbi:glucosaminidase domain-containing protein [Candidatus Saccharibacteria bacterium]|nr:glucosaminidase domain-containing protein [Candidatus Saccharibacteria bacterium]MCB9834557.1 glucosaminidase domain-containing protein [Candidatus Nomurabacteria bacterium]
MNDNRADTGPIEVNPEQFGNPESGPGFNERTRKWLAGLLAVAVLSVVAHKVVSSDNEANYCDNTLAEMIEVPMAKAGYSGLVVDTMENGESSDKYKQPTSLSLVYPKDKVDNITKYKQEIIANFYPNLAPGDPRAESLIAEDDRNIYVNLIPGLVVCDSLEEALSTADGFGYNTGDFGQIMFELPEGGYLVVSPSPRFELNQASYIVSKGDTLYAIAQKYGVSVADLITANGIEPTDLKPGQVIKIPLSSKAETSDQVEGEVNELSTFTNQYQEAARQTGLPVDAVLAMAYLESDGGTSELAREANNLFGLKVRDYSAINSLDQVYIKKTAEYFTEDQLIQEQRRLEEFNLKHNTDLTVRVVGEEGNQYQVEVDALFHKYSSPEKSFGAFRDRLENYRLSESDKQSAESFIGAITDSEGLRYSTDPEYYDKLVKLASQVWVALQAGGSMGVIQISQPDKTEQIPQLGPVAANLDNQEGRPSLELSREGYQEFINSLDTSIISISGQRERFIRGEFPGPVEFITLHFTAANLEPLRQAQADNLGVPASEGGRLFNSMADKGKMVHMFVGSEGTYQFAPFNVWGVHNPPYSEVSIGVEVEAEKYEDITKEQFEQLVYSLLYMIKSTPELAEKLENAPTIEGGIEELVKGHAEVRDEYLKNNPGAGVDGREDFWGDDANWVRGNLLRLLQENPDLLDR